MRLGNKAIALKLCKNVLIRDVTIFHGGHFAILVTGCDNLTVDNVTMDTDRDGIDIDCCRNTMVSNCRINSPNDDGICPKSTYALGEIRPTENLTIVNCQVSGFVEGTLIDGTHEARAETVTGRIKFGTESSGGFRNCTVANCTFRSCHGLALEEVDGGILENITINNLTMMDVRDYAIYITTGKRNRTPGFTTNSRARNILISNVIADGVDKMSGIQICGLPEQPVEGVRLENIRLTSNGGGTAEDAARDPKELGNGYPEAGKLGICRPTAIFARHVRDLELANIHVNFRTNDLRPAAMLCGHSGTGNRQLQAAGCRRREGRPYLPTTSAASPSATRPRCKKPGQNEEVRMKKRNGRDHQLPAEVNPACSRFCISFIFFHRPAGGDHALEAADERVDFFVAHSLCRVARHCRAEAAAAIHDDFRVRVGIKFFEVALQNALAQMHGLRRVAGLPLVIFAHIEQHHLGNAWRVWRAPRPR